MLFDDKWQLYDLKTNKLVNDKKYDDIYYIKDNYFFEVSGNNGYIINEKGERLHDMPISVNFEIDIEGYIYDASSIYIEENEAGTFFEITSYKEPLNDDNYEDSSNVNMYKFDLKTHLLFKLQ